MCVNKWIFILLCVSTFLFFFYNSSNTIYWFDSHYNKSGTVHAHELLYFTILVPYRIYRIYRDETNMIGVWQKPNSQVMLVLVLLCDILVWYCPVLGNIQYEEHGTTRHPMCVCVCFCRRNKKLWVRYWCMLCTIYMIYSWHDYLNVVVVVVNY